MGKPGAIEWSNLVDSAHVRFEVEKLARCGTVHPVSAAALLIQPLILEFPHAHSKMCRNSFHILQRVSRSHRFATVRATDAVAFFPHFMLHRGGEFVQFFWGIFFKPCENSS